MQIHREMERLAQGRKFRVGLLSKAVAATGRAAGGRNALGHFDVLVATPMRLVGVLREGAVDLSHVEVGKRGGLWLGCGCSASSNALYFDAFSCTLCLLC